METFGALHVAFNNAGVHRYATFVDTTDDMVSKVFDTNLKSLVFCFKYQVRFVGNKARMVTLCWSYYS